MDARGKQSTSATAESFPARAIPDERHQQTPGAQNEFVEGYPPYYSLVRDIPAIPLFDIAADELLHMPSGSRDSGWQNCLDSVEKYDRDVCQAHREQIDTLLVFAGLFSAVVTAFAVESYQWLQDDPLDTSVELLRDVVGLLAQNLNMTAHPTTGTAQQLSGSAIARINSFWFLSLTLSLTAALVGILCKQWLREFERNVGQSPETALAVRYIRFQGLEFWKVGSIVTSVPIILQAALACFLIGIIELLWHLHTIVACCVTVTAGLTLAFYLATTFLPVVQYAYICIRCCARLLQTRYYSTRLAFTEPQCAYKSAQAWLAFRAVRPVINRLLTASGYQFSSHHPPAFTDPILRRTDSWIAFDLNWVKCRGNIHIGPRCAFESLTWIPGNLGEMQMSSWIWHCVWACWLRNKDSHDTLSRATEEIASVARSYPRVAALDDHNTPAVRSQALLFQCSLRSDLPVDTALELLLRVASEVGAGSEWTQEALHAVLLVHRGLSVRLSDDIATSLFRLAELQTNVILYGPDVPRPGTRLDAALGFKDISAMLIRGTHLRDRFLPIMSGFALRWLRAHPSGRMARIARAVFEDMIWYLLARGYRGPAVSNIRQSRGIIFIAKLAGKVAEIWPEYVRDAYERSPEPRAVLQELLALYSEGLPELSRARSVDGVEPRPGPACSAEGERSHAPFPDAHDVGAHVSAEIRASELSPREQLCIDVHGDAVDETQCMEIDVNAQALPAGSRMAAASPTPSSSPVVFPDFPTLSIGPPKRDR